MTNIGSDVRELNSTDISAKFFIHFQAKKNEIESRIDVLKSSTPLGNSVPPELELLSSEVLSLRKDLIDATPYLPAYDRGKCEQQLKTFEEAISQQRPSKPKFSFKRKALTPSAQSEQSSQKDIKSHRSPVPVTLTPSQQTPSLTVTSRSREYLTQSSLIQFSNPPLNPPVLPSSSDVTLTDIKDCIVNLLPTNSSNTSETSFSITALYAKNLERVLLLAPPINGSVLLYGVKNSILVLGCHQFRTHDTVNTSVFLYVHSNPIIEGSHDLRFGTYPEALRVRFGEGFFHRLSNHHSVQDFDWIKSDPSPNWRVEDNPLLITKVIKLVENDRDIQDVSQPLAEILSQ